MSSYGAWRLRTRDRSTDRASAVEGVRPIDDRHACDTNPRFIWRSRALAVPGPRAHRIAPRHPAAVGAACGCSGCPDDVLDPPAVPRAYALCAYEFDVSPFDDRALAGLSDRVRGGFADIVAAPGIAGRLFACLAREHAPADGALRQPDQALLTPLRFDVSRVRGVIRIVRPRTRAVAGSRAGVSRCARTFGQRGRGDAAGRCDPGCAA